MTDKKTYWLISYTWRRLGQSDVNFANDATDLSPCAWLREVASDDREEYVLLSALPISAADFRWAKDNL